jgi:GNAT superfamily N-acetyltransferase
LRISLEPSPAAVADEIERRLLAALGHGTGPGDYAELGVTARDVEAGLIGGLIGSTSHGWLLVKMLWVAEAARGRGLGTRLMARAETEALARGCHGAWLDTSSMRAEAFYRRLGYRPFGMLENRPGEQPERHRRHFLCKRLSGPLRRSRHVDEPAVLP